MTDWGVSFLEGLRIVRRSTVRRSHSFAERETPMTTGMRTQRTPNVSAGIGVQCQALFGRPPWLPRKTLEPGAALRGGGLGGTRGLHENHGE
jgi:hypothetical protein